MGKNLEHYKQKMWVISNIIRSNFGQNVENVGQNLENYKIFVHLFFRKKSTLKKKGHQNLKDKTHNLDPNAPAYTQVFMVWVYTVSRSLSYGHTLLLKM